MLTEVLISTIAILFLSIYIKFKRSFRFWKERNVPFIPPVFPVGNTLEIMKGKIHSSLVFEKLYKQMKHTGEYCGLYLFNNPALLVLSPEFAKTILVKDFNYFIDRGMFSNEKDDPLSANLFFLEGQRWKDLRAKLTPTFTSGKLRVMFPTLFEVGQKFINHIHHLGKINNTIDIYDLLLRLNTDVISSVAYGFESNTLENPQTEFRTMGKRMLAFSGWKSLKIMLASSFPNIGKTLKIRFNDEDVAEFFSNIVKETIEYRKNTGLVRKDFMQLLIDLMEKDDNEEEKLTFNEIAAQAYVIYFAGFETSSTVTCFALHFLAHNQDIQDKARQTVQDVLQKHDNVWCYEAIMEMTYIQQIVEESMRIYPPVSSLIRVASTDYKLPNGSTIPKGTNVIIPNLAFQRDSKVFPDPLKFDPERFNPEMTHTRHSFAHLPFGEGPRFCIGMRFGYLQTKLTVALMLSNFKLTPSAQTENPVKINPLTLIYGPLGEVWLNVENILK